VRSTTAIPDAPFAGRQPVIAQPQFSNDIDRTDETVRWTDPNVTKVLCCQAPGIAANTLAV
jgi:hypothetical protein